MSTESENNKTAQINEPINMPGQIGIPSPIPGVVEKPTFTPVPSNGDGGQNPEEKRKSLDRLSAAGILISIGIVFGDIGTSPLYTLQGIAREQPISQLVALGGVSAIFWTLTFQTTFKS